MPRITSARAVVVAGYVLAACAFTWPLPLHLSTHLTGDPGGDTGVYVWNQWVFHQELIAGHNPLATEKILALSGSPADLTQHNYTAFLNVLALPLISGLGIVAAFNVVFLLICSLNGLAAYALARHATRATRWEAFLAGLVFAWSPAMVARTTGHFSIVAAAALPAFLLALSRADRSRSLRDAALVGLCMAWAALSDAYYGIYCVMIALLFVGASAVRFACPEVRKTRTWIWPLDLLILCFGGLIGGLLAGYGGDFTLLGVPVHVRTLYTPVLVFTLLVVIRAALWLRPQLDLASLGRLPAKAVLVEGSCAATCRASAAKSKPSLPGLSTANSCRPRTAASRACSSSTFSTSASACSGVLAGRRPIATSGWPSPSTSAYRFSEATRPKVPSQPLSDGT